MSLLCFLPGWRVKFLTRGRKLTEGVWETRLRNYARMAAPRALCTVRRTGSDFAGLVRMGRFDRRASRQNHSGLYGGDT